MRFQDERSSLREPGGGARGSFARGTITLLVPHASELLVLRPILYALIRLDLLLFRLHAHHASVGGGPVEASAGGDEGIEDGHRFEGVLGEFGAVFG